MPERYLLLDDESARIEVVIPDRPDSEFENKMLVGFGEIGSDLDTPGFAEELAGKLSIPYAAVKQPKRTQYQYLSRAMLQDAIAPLTRDYSMYFYGSSLGGYCAAYYARPVGANFLALSPRLPTHPITNRRMTIKFSSPGVLHSMMSDGIDASKDSRQAVMIDKGNSIDMFYALTDLAYAFPRMELYDVPGAGHYVPRALLVSRSLKNTLLDFLHDKPFTFRVDTDAILGWHTRAFHRRLKKGYIGHCIEHVEAIARLDPRSASELSAELNALSFP